jgi:Ca2+-dependent lipid-binding protein
METKFILLNNLTESLVLSVYDYNDHRKNTLLGAASFELPALLEDATQEGLERPILKDGKERGTLRFDISFYPVLKPEAGSNGEEIMQDTCALRALRVVVQHLISCSLQLLVSSA